MADFNLDGKPDLYVANDGNPNQLWIQHAHGGFMDEALLSGSAVSMTGSAEAGMGVAAFDLENDGDMDLFMTHLRDETNTLYINNGDGFFDDMTAPLGLAAPSLGFTGFGTGFADFDHDGALDLYVANGRVGQGMAALVEKDAFAEPNQLFQRQANGVFQEVLPRGGTARRSSRIVVAPPSGISTTTATSISRSRIMAVKLAFSKTCIRRWASG